MSWHVDDPTLAAYAAGATTPATAASTEAHLTACSRCRALLPRPEAGRLDAIWAEVEHRVDRLSLPWPERVLLRLGVREDTARLLAATPSLTTAWLLSVGAAVLFAVVAADASPKGLAVFLTLAPMLPVAGVAAAYGRLADPAYELAVASPYSLLRLLLVRSVAVVGTTVAVTAVGGLALTDAGLTAAAWLLPALGLTVTTLALSGRFPPVWVSAAVVTSWLGAVLIARQATGDRLAAFGTVGQLVAVAVLALAVGALVHQRTTFAYDSRRSA